MLSLFVFTCSPAPMAGRIAGLAFAGCTGARPLDSAVVRMLPTVPAVGGQDQASGRLGRAV